jgi:hypothetical protein
MAKRLNYYFRQKVSESELDNGFAFLEDGDQNIMLDMGQTGILSGMVVTQRGAGPNLSVDVSSGVTYDKAGQRIQFAATQNVDVSADESAVSTVVAGGGNSKIISVFAKFKRTLSDPRTDGNSVTVYFQEDESFEFIIRQGAEAPSPSPPPLDPTYVLLADITRAFGDTTITNAMIDVSATNRREEVFKITNGATHRMQRGSVRNALSDLLGWLNTEIDDRDSGDTAVQGNLDTHISNATDAHDASAISFLASQSAWADAEDLVATDVQAAIDEIVTDLTAAGGAAKIGATGNAAGYVFGTAGTTIQAQIDEIVDYLDEGTLGRRVWTYVDADSPVAVTTERQILTFTSGGGITFNLPAPTHGREIYFKDGAGTWGTSPIQLVPNGAEEIEGVAGSRYFYADYGSFRLFSDGTDWFIG